MTARVTVVVGAVGGVGASTLAALLARRRAAAGGPALLVDLDLGRGGIDVLLGLERAPGVRWPDLAGVRGTLALDDLDGLLPRWRGVDVLSAGRPAGTRAEAGSLPAVDAATRGPWAGDGAGRGAWGSRELGHLAVAAVCAAVVAAGQDVVVDLPAGVVQGAVVTTAGVPAGPRSAPGGAPPPESPWAELLRVARVLVVTGQDVLGVAGGVAAASSLGARCDGVVLRRRRRARVAPAEVAGALGAPVAGMLPGDRAVAVSTDRGLGPVPVPWSPLARAVRRIEGARS